MEVKDRVNLNFRVTEGLIEFASSYFLDFAIAGIQGKTFRIDILLQPSGCVGLIGDFMGSVDLVGDF